MSHLALFLFGPPRLELAGAPVKIDRHKAVALIAYLAMHPERHSRNTLATLLWPNYDQSRARSALRRTLAALNQAGLTAWLEADREALALKQRPDFWLDVAEFRRSMVPCQALNEALNQQCLTHLTQGVALYQGDFMAGFSLRDSLAFDEWQLLQAESLRQMLITMLARLTRYYRQQNNLEPAFLYARRWVEIDSLHETAHRELMQLYSQSGQRAAALRQYQECVRLLEQELGISPSAETAALYETIHRSSPRQKSRPFLPQEPASPPSPPPAYAQAFPLHPIPFIGRQKEMHEIGQRLQNPACHLLTLTGPGGIGKTRLALQAAMEHGPAFQDGFYFVPLASVSSPDFLLPAIAGSLQLSLDGQADWLPQLLNILASRQVLLVLDNFEHLMKKVSLIAELLAQAPGLKILVTSRERLNLQGEWVFEIKGMSYPADPHTGDIEHYGAVALFLERARRVSSGFKLADDDKPHLVRLCRLLNGAPLGIELAASWLPALSCQEIATEIERIYQAQAKLDFLTTSLRDIPSRHQNLKGVFEQSWQLLSEAESDLFMKLSVFRGGARREAIEGVMGASLTLILALIDKSLLSRGDAGRYEMHELVRQYAVEKLEQWPVTAREVRDRHSDYYAAFLRQREAQLKGASQKETLAEIARDIENIRISWQWILAEGRISALEASLDSLWYFYSMYSWFQEGVEAFGRAAVALSHVSGVEETEILPLRGRIMTYLGWFFLRQGLYEPARELLEQSLAILKRFHDPARMAAPLHHLGLLAGELGELAQARQYLEESLALYREAGNTWGTAWTLSSLAYYLTELDLASSPTARRLLQESLAIYQAIGNKHGIAIALNNLGYMAFRENNLLPAKELLQESLALRREIGFPRGIAVALNNLGHVTSALGDYEACRAYYTEALKIARDIGTLPLILAALGGLAAPLAYEGRLEQALEMLALTLHHPASNKESRDRATAFLAHLKVASPSLSPRPAPLMPELETIIEAVLSKPSGSAP